MYTGNITKQLCFVKLHFLNSPVHIPLQNPIAVTLSPPPDLVVSSLTVEEEYHTGSEMVINYTVTNNGAGAPFESFWTDRTVSE